MADREQDMMTGPTPTNNPADGNTNWPKQATPKPIPSPLNDRPKRDDGGRFRTPFAPDN